MQSLDSRALQTSPVHSSDEMSVSDLSRQSTRLVVPQAPRHFCPALPVFLPALAIIACLTPKLCHPIFPTSIIVSQVLPHRQPRSTPNSIDLSHPSPILHSDQTNRAAVPRRASPPPGTSDHARTSGSGNPLLLCISNHISYRAHPLSCDQMR